VEQNGIGITSQKYLPGTRLVRAFNTMNYMIFAREANRPDPKLAIPMAGDDPDALRLAEGLVRDAGFEPVVVGKLADARRFQRGGPGYGQQVSAAELKQKRDLSARRYVYVNRLAPSCLPASRRSGEAARAKDRPGNRRWRRRARLLEGAR